MGVVIYNPTVQPTVYGAVWHSVWVKQHWADDWQYVPWLDCLTCSETAAPSVSNAMLRYNYGMMLRKNTSAWAEYFPIMLNGWYVAVLAHDYYGDQLMWVGIVECAEIRPHGTADYPQGTTLFPAYGLEHTFDRRVVVGSFTDEGFIDRGLKFNKRDRRGLVNVGNRSTSVNASGVYVFSADGELWTNLQILEYLIAGYCAEGITWEVVGARDALDAIVSEHDLQGLTPLQAINRLIDYKRGLTWRIVTSGSGTVYLYVFSILMFPAGFGDVYVPANEDQAFISLTGALDASARLNVTDLTRYDTICVRGGRIGTCCSLSFADGTLVEGWDADTETAYEAGSDIEEATAEQHDAARTVDAYRHVYQRFTVPSDWNFYSGDGEGGTLYNAVPGCSWDGTVSADTVAVCFPPGLEFERMIPIEDDAPEFGGDSEFREPFVLIEATDSDDNTAYRFIDRLDALESHTNIGLRMIDGQLAFQLNARIPHVLALNHWAEGAADSSVEPLYDYESIIATVFFETDAHLQVVASVPGNWVSETGKTKLIEMPEANAWYIVPGTVTDIDDGELVKSDGGLLRDDSTVLRQTAAFASAWYGQQRATAEITFQNIGMWLPVGFLLTGLIDNWHLQEIGTIVTRRTWDFVRRTTTVETGFRELQEGKPDAGMGVLEKAPTRNVKTQRQHRTEFAAVVSAAHEALSWSGV